MQTFTLKTSRAIRNLVWVAAGATLLISSQLVNAASTVNCPGTVATTDREFSLTTTLPTTCLTFGTGNINGNNDAINNLGYLTLDKTDVFNNIAEGALSITGGPDNGSFTLNTTILTEYKDFVLALKSGNGRFSPDWVAFTLNGATSGTWTISINGYSHGILYGNPNPVPLPAAAWLFGSALLGFVGVSRRKKA